MASFLRFPLLQTILIFHGVLLKILTSQTRALLFVFVSVFLVSFETIAQKEAEEFTAKRSVYLGIGGTSGRYAVNYGKIIHQKEKLKLNASVGFSMWDHRADSRTTWLPVVPVELSAFYGKSNHHLELGIGVISYLTRSLTFDEDRLEIIDEVVFSATALFRVGYRYQKPEGGFFLRVGYTPAVELPIGSANQWDFQPIWGGISLGTSF